MRYKPNNIVELAAYVAAIRPGFKSMLETFVSRTPFTYNIPSLDKLLMSKEIPSSFLMYDEQVLSVLIAAGIPASDAYVCLKAIKKKKADKVAPFKKLFKEGFSKHLQKEEGRSKQEADKVCDQILRIIEDSASYLFNASHSVCMGCDSLYVAWLKAHHTYKLYTTMLEIYDKKKDLKKLSRIIDEMKKYKGITLLSGRWGQDNTKWSADVENNTISQSISSIRYMSKQTAEELYNISSQDTADLGVTRTKDVFTKEANQRIKRINKELKPLQKKAEEFLKNGGDTFDEDFMNMYDTGLALEKDLSEITANDSSYISRAQDVHHIEKLDCFTYVLRAIHMNTHVNTRQLEILIKLGYFSKFGKPGKLMRVFNRYFNGEKNLKNKDLASFQERLKEIRTYEESLNDVDLPIDVQLRNEFDNIGLCLSVKPTAPNLLYFVQSIDDRYTIKVQLYNVRRGTIGEVKIAKKYYIPFEKGDCIEIQKFRQSPKYTYRNGKKTVLPGESEYWVSEYKIIKQGETA